MTRVRTELMQRFGCSERDALRIVGMSASTYRYESRKRDEAVLKLQIKDITNTRVRYGKRRVHVMLRCEDHLDDVKHVYRLYKEEGLEDSPSTHRIAMRNCEGCQRHSRTRT